MTKIYGCFCCILHKEMPHIVYRKSIQRCYTCGKVGSFRIRNDRTSGINYFLNLRICSLSDSIISG